jgi:hypothetical protein
VKTKRNAKEISDTKAYVKVTADTNKVEQQLSAAQKAARAFGAEFEGAAEKVNDASDRVTRLLSSPYAAVAALSAAIVALGVEAVSEAARMDTAFRALQGALPSETDTAQMDALRQEIVSLTAISPRTAAELSGVAKAIAEMGEANPQEIAANLKTLALVGDALGKTDLGPLADNLDLIGDAFGLSADQARRAFVEIAQMAKGRIDIAELAAVLGKSATQLSAMGVSATSAASAITLLIDKGVDRRKITSGLVDLLDRAGQADRAALDAEAAKQDGTAKALRVLGEALSDANVRSKGLVGALADLYTGLDGSKPRFLQAKLSVEQFTIAQKAAEAQADGSATKTLSYADALDRLTTAAALNRKSAQALGQIVKNELNAVLTDLGNVVLPTVIQVLDGFTLMLSKSRREARFFAKDVVDTAAELRALAAQEAKSGQRLQFAPGAAIRTIDEQAAAVVRQPVRLQGLDERQLLTLYESIQAASRMLDGADALQLIASALANISGESHLVTKELPPAKKGFDEVSAAARAAAEKLDAAREAYAQMRLGFSNASDAEKAARSIDTFAEAQRKAGVDAAIVSVRVATLQADLNRLQTDRATKEFRTFTDALEENAVALAAMMKAEADRQTVVRQSRADTEAEINLARLRTEALRTGSVEDEKAVIAAEKKLVVEKARAAAAMENGANETTVAMAGNLAARAFDASQQVNELQKALQRLGEGDIAGKLASVAQQFTSIATSLGAAGQNIAKVAGILGPLLSGASGLNSALTRIKTDADGNVVKDAKGNAVTESLGFFSTLGGKNGAAAQAKAVASAVSIAAIAFQIADALDLFGTNAKARARQLAEAAAQFNAALADFAAQANPETGAAAKIAAAQKQAAALQKQALDASGFQFKGIAPTTATSDSLTKQADEFRAAADTIKSKIFKPLADQLRTLAGRYDELSAALKENEQAAREQVLRNIEDLAVRRLQAAGLTTEAERLRKSIAATRELATAERDTTEEGKRYYEALKAIQQAEAAAAAETQRRAAIQQKLTDDNAVLGGTGPEKLGRTVKAFGETFAQFGTIFDGFDMSTREGLSKAKAAAIDLYQTLSQDGIDDLERPIVEWIKSIVGDIDSLISALPGALDPVTAGLEAFDERVKTFGTSLPQRLNELRTIYKGMFGDWWDAMLMDVDLGDAGSRAALKQNIVDQINAILSDGVISEAERPMYEGLQRFLGIVNQAIDDAIAAAEAARLADAAKRTQNVGLDIQLNDLTGADAFTATLGKYAGAFRAALGTFDVSSLSGIEAATSNLKDFYQSIDGLSDAQLVEKYGMTRDEILAALGEIDSGLDGLGQALSDLATKQADFLDQVNLAYLDAFGEGLDAVKLQTEIWVAQMIATAKALGVWTQDLEGRINAIGDQRITNYQKQQADQSSATAASGGAGRNYTITGGVTLEDLAKMTPQERAAYYESTAIQQFAGGVNTGQVQAMAQNTSANAASSTPLDQFVASDITRLSETTALRMTDYLASGLVEWRGTRVAAEAIAAGFAAIMGGGGAAAILPPTLPTTRGTVGIGGAITVNININGPVSGTSAVDVARQLAESAAPYINEALARAAGIEARGAGRPTLS